MGVRDFLRASLIIMMSASAHAQVSGLNSASLPTTPPNVISPPVPPSTALSLPVLRDKFGADPRTYVPDQRPPRRFPFFPIVGGGFPFVGGGYPYGYVDSQYPYEEARERRMRETGYLALDLRPGSTQVYVDGSYIGTVDDLRRMIPGRSLEAGVHHVELRAAGYETATFDVRISPGETVSYRRDLDVARPTMPTRTIPAPSPRTFYVIAGCYAGDRPPDRSQLRRGCDTGRLRVIPPVGP